MKLIKERSSLARRDAGSTQSIGIFLSTGGMIGLLDLGLITSFWLIKLRLEWGDFYADVFGKRVMVDVVKYS